MRKLYERTRRNGVKNMTDITKQYFSRRDLAEMFGVTTQAILNWEKGGRLTPIKLGPQTVRYSRANVEALIAGSKANAPA